MINHKELEELTHQDGCRWHRVGDGLCDCGAGTYAELIAAREERDALRAQVAKLRKNSDRYLWLRDHSEHAPPNERGESVWPVIGTSCVSNLPCVGNDLDAACDAAIAERARDHSA